MDELQRMLGASARSQRESAVMCHTLGNEETAQLLFNLSHLLELAAYQSSEMFKAFSSSAFGAAATFGAAALETFLLCKCIVDRDRVCAMESYLKGWAGKPFSAYIDSRTLGRLLQTASVLGWFPSSGFPDAMRQHLRTQLGAESADMLINCFADVDNVGAACSEYVLKFRDLLHPSVSLRGQWIPQEHEGIGASYLALFAFSALAENFRAN